MVDKRTYRPTIIVTNKLDKRAEQNLNEFSEKRDDGIPFLIVSCKNRTNLDKIGQLLFKTLDIMRVYSILKLYYVIR